MPDSWRNILERAAANLSIELDQKSSREFRNRSAGWSAPRRPAPLSRSIVETRDLLARELEAISEQVPRNRSSRAQQQGRPAESAGRASRPAADYAVTAPAPRAQPRSRKTKSWRNLLAVSVSGVIVSLTAYAFLDQEEAGKGGALALIEEATILEQASNRLSHGDGAAARAFYATAAQQGSKRAAFSLAETYDPKVLALHPIRGLTADRRLAREWYEKAAQLGSLIAFQRLNDIDGANGPR
jgi:hypothetical protein